MLRVGLTGGIGAGKSTVAGRLAELGAVLIDSDLLAREVVAPGTPGLAEVVAAFGERVRSADGSLDRAALAEIVFADAGSRARLNEIVHPLIRARSAAMVDAAAPDSILVHDVPLLVEAGMGPAFHLVVVVDAPVEQRVQRLAAGRGMSEVQARARIHAQSGDAARRSAADVWLDNGDSRGAVLAEVDRLWERRLVPFEANLRQGHPADLADGPPVAAQPEWAAQGARLAARIAHAGGALFASVQHVGPTAVPGLDAADRIDLLVGTVGSGQVGSVDAGQVGLFGGVSAGQDGPVGPIGPGQNGAPDPVPDRKVRAALAAAGFPAVSQDAAGLFAAADPGRPAMVHVLPVASGAWRAALIVRDWLRADEGARDAWRAAGGLEPGAALAAAQHWATARDQAG